MQQIRLTKTSELKRVLNYLSDKYRLLSEAEIIKLALSEKYSRESIGPGKKDKDIKRAWEELKIEGKKIGDRLLAEKGLRREDVTEQQFYDIFLDDHKHDA